MSDRFEDIKTFVAVVEQRTFVAAAASLNVVKSAVSRRVRDLENRLGTQLLIRTTRQLRVTDAGALFYQRGLRLLADLADAEESAASTASRASGRLRVVAPATFATHYLARAASAFVSSHPGLKVEILSSDKLPDTLKEEVDVVFHLGRLKDSSLIGRRLGPIEHVVCASPDYVNRYGAPRSGRDLMRHQVVEYLTGLSFDPRMYFSGEDISDPQSGWPSTLQML